MKISHVSLKQFVQMIFEKAGCRSPEAERIGHYLVEANLVGHDSHGVIRVADYVRYLQTDGVCANQSLQIVFQTDSMAIADGQFGFGQVIGEQAVKLGIEMAQRTGMAAVGLRNSGHLGRIGDWPTLAAEAGLVSLHFVNTSGFGLLVAPFGGIDRRLSANPIAAGVPVANAKPIILDISTSSIAEGKLKVARNKGQKVPTGCIINSEGKPTDDPREFYTKPPGALLPFGAHKGYGLSVITEIFAGALTGNGCSHPSRAQRMSNGMWSLYIDPHHLPAELAFGEEVQQFIEFVKSSRRVTPNGEILMPGEIEERTRAERLANGIEIDQTTWATITSAAESVGIEE